MKLAKWFDARPGRMTALARYFGRTLSAVSQWRDNGVPRRLMRAVVEYTHGDVTLEDMVPPSDKRKPAVKRKLVEKKVVVESEGA